MSSEEIKSLIASVKQQQKEWLDAKDMFEEFSISKSTQAKMRMAKILPYHKIGKFVKYKRSDINEMFNDAKVV